MPTSNELEYRVVINTKDAKVKLEQFARDANASLKRVESGAKDAQGGFKGLFKTITGGVAAGQLLADAFKELLRLAKEYVKFIYRMTVEFQALNATLKATTSGMESLGSAQKFLRAEAERLGINYRGMVKGYSQLMATAKAAQVPLEDIKNIFTAINEASVVFQLSAEDTYQSMRAIIQMFSKGTISAEELRGQLGERIPGAVYVMAEAVGVTTQELFKMMEQGELLASEVLPKFARAMREHVKGELEGTTNTLRRETDRLKNAWESLANAVGSLLEGPIAQTIHILTVGINTLKEAVEAAGSVVDRLSNALGIEVGVESMNDEQRYAYAKRQLEELRRTGGSETLQNFYRNIMKDIEARGKAEEELKRQAGYYQPKVKDPSEKGYIETPTTILADRSLDADYLRMTGQTLKADIEAVKIRYEKMLEEEEKGSVRYKQLLRNEAAEIAKIRRDHNEKMLKEQQKTAEKRLKSVDEELDKELDMFFEYQKSYRKQREETEKFIEQLLQDRADAEKKAMDEMMEKYNQFGEEVSSTFKDIFKSLITGAQSWKEAMIQILQRIGDAFIELAFKQLEAAAVSGSGSSSIAGLIGNFISGFFGAGSSAGASPKVYHVAEGGILQGGLKAFANGGIADRPTLGLVGEGKYNEAVVPLPDGKKIPVEMRGGGATIVNNITVTNSQPASQENNNNMANEISRQIETSIKKIMAKEMKPGGIYNKTYMMRTA